MDVLENLIRVRLVPRRAGNSIKILRFAFVDEVSTLHWI